MNEGQYNRPNRPNPQVSTSGQDTNMSVQRQAHSPQSNKKDKKNIFTKIAVIALVVFVVAVLAYGIFLFNKNSTSSQIKKDQYQAVFLNDVNGQIYFGKLSIANKDYYKLTDIYYVRVEQVQPDRENSQTQQNISLAKLGNEIHGPEDVMYINRDSVLFWENLKDDGQVVRAITNFKANPNQENTNTNTNTNTNNNSNNTENTNQ